MYIFHAYVQWDRLPTRLEERAFRNSGLGDLIFMLRSFHHLNYHIVLEFCSTFLVQAWNYVNAFPAAQQKGRKGKSNTAWFLNKKIKWGQARKGLCLGLPGWTCLVHGNQELFSTFNPTLLAGSMRAQVRRRSQSQERNVLTRWVNQARQRIPASDCWHGIQFEP